MESIDFILFVGMVVACASSFWYGYKTGIAGQLKKILGKLEMLEQEIIKRDIAHLLRKWKIIAEKPLADHSKIVDINKRTLIVEVDHPGWMQYLRLIEKKILKKIGKFYPNLDIDGFYICISKIDITNDN